MKATADRLFGDDYYWSILGAGRHQTQPRHDRARSSGGNVRVGLEDSIYLAQGPARRVERRAGGEDRADPRRAVARDRDADEARADALAQGPRGDRDPGAGRADDRFLTSPRRATRLEGSTSNAAPQRAPSARKPIRPDPVRENVRPTSGVAATISRLPHMLIIPTAAPGASGRARAAPANAGANGMPAAMPRVTAETTASATGPEAARPTLAAAPAARLAPTRAGSGSDGGA